MAEIGPLASPGERYALVDFPCFANVGDSMIWLGAAAVLRDLTGRLPIHVSAAAPGALIGLKRRLGAGTIYINGGGNFGDLWPPHQRFRESLLAHFPDNRIVQLPQTVHFRSQAALDRASAAIRDHCGFHLIVRDRMSELFALRHFDCPVTLAPDCAFALGPLEPSANPACNHYALMRTDQERRAAGHSAIRRLGPREADWGREPNLRVACLKLCALADSILPGGLPGSPMAYRFDRMARRRLLRGIAMLSSGRQVVTDRLHAHILCLLLDIPHVALDNSYGKIGACHRDWTSGFETARFAADGEAAVAALASLPKRSWRETPKRRAIGPILPLPLPIA
jgi:pyruvyl transferase EpsO